MSKKSDTRGTMKRPAANECRYTSEFLMKLQKSKLSKKAPDCIDVLGRENILRNSWKTEKEEKKEEKEKPITDLGMTRMSFVAGCQRANLQPEKPVSNLFPSLITKDPVATTKDRKYGSGRLGNRDLAAYQKEYGYGNAPEKNPRRSHDNRPMPNDHRRNKMEHHSHNDAFDRPEWFTEGPTSRMDVIELGGFDEHKPAKSEPEKKREEPVEPKEEPREMQSFFSLEELQKQIGRQQAPPKSTSPIDLDNLFAKAEPAAVPREAPMLGHSRFMAEIFSKPEEPPREAPIQHRPPMMPDPFANILEPQESSQTLGDLMNFGRMSTMNNRMPSNMPMMPPMSRMGGFMEQERFEPPVQEPPKVNNQLNIFEQLLGLNCAPGPQPPVTAKSVEELEADLKMISGFHKNSMPPQPPQAMQMPRNNGHPQMYQKPKTNGGMTQNGVYGNVQQQPPSFETFFSKLANQPMPPQPTPSQHSNTHNIPVDLLRLFKQEPPSHQPSYAPKASALKQQDMKNVPTQVLLREKNILRDGGQGPRAIVKSNKNPPMGTSSVSQPDVGADILQKFFEGSQPPYGEMGMNFNQQFRQPPPPQMGARNPQMRQMHSRPLMGMHGQPRYMDAPQHRQPPPQEVVLDSNDALIKWFGNLSCNQPTLPVPANVLRVDELERLPFQNKLPTAT